MPSIHTIGEANFRTRNIVKNIDEAMSVKIVKDHHIVEFYSEYKSNGTVKETSIKYAIKSSLVDRLKREKIESTNS